MRAGTRLRYAAEVACVNDSDRLERCRHATAFVERLMRWQRVVGNICLP